MKMNLPSLAAVVALTLCGALNATAAIVSFVDVNLAGWQAAGAFDASDDTDNTRLVIPNLGTGTTITGFEYTNLRFTTSGDSYISEFIISVNNTAITEWLDWRPSTTQAGGSVGPISGSFGGPTGQGGPYGAGGPFTLVDGQILVTTYLSYFIDPVGITVQSGNLRINLVAIPEPSSYAMVALGLAGIAGARRRRRSDS